MNEIKSSSQNSVGLLNVIDTSQRPFFKYSDKKQQERESSKTNHSLKQLMSIILIPHCSYGQF